MRYPARTMERCGHEKQLKTCRILGASRGRAGVYAIRPSRPAVGTKVDLTRGAPGSGGSKLNGRLAKLRGAQSSTPERP